jgi:ATP-dependent RNA helicase DDX27
MLIIFPTLSFYVRCRDLTQAQRFRSLDEFRTGVAQVMVATDVAARGLDIPGVRTVVNAEMPRTAATYIHRVGRTARAGSGGRSITLVSDDRRKVVKEVLKVVLVRVCNVCVMCVLTHPPR